jgi:hypothetical protein
MSDSSSRALSSEFRASISFWLRSVFGSLPWSDVASFYGRADFNCATGNEVRFFASFGFWVNASLAARHLKGGLLALIFIAYKFKMG